MKGEAAEAAAPSVCVCIATCRRPAGLRRTLMSLGEQQLPASAAQVRIVVVDNDGQQAGRAMAESVAGQLPFPVKTGYAPEPGISFARNLSVALAGPCTYLAFIDDDEVACKRWLSELLRVATRTGAQAVLGPVERTFDAQPPPWLASMWRDMPRAEAATVPEGVFRTSNLLLRRDALASPSAPTGRDGPFDPAFALSGGSDYVLGQALRARGARFVWAPGAVVTERVPKTRSKLSWYLQRRYRTGMTYVRAQQRQRGRLMGTARGLYRGAGSLAAGGVGLALATPGRDPKALVDAVGLLSYAAGALIGAAGGRYQEYRR